MNLMSANEVYMYDLSQVIKNSWVVVQLLLDNADQMILTVVCGS